MAKKLKKVEDKNIKTEDNKKKVKKKLGKVKKAKKTSEKVKDKGKLKVNPSSLSASDINSVLDTFNLLISNLANLNNEPLKYNGEVFYKNELDVLKEIANSDSISLITLANTLNTTKNTIIKTTNKLIHKNLIDKEKNSLTNESFVKVNDNGKEVLAAVPIWELKKKEPITAALKKMNPTELAFFNAAIERILMNTIK